MKARLFSLAALAVTATLLAPDAALANGGGGRGGHRPNPQQMFDRLDADKDGKISRTEAAAVPLLATNFDTIDADHDGFLTKDELRAAAQAHRQAGGGGAPTGGGGGHPHGGGGGGSCPHGGTAPTP